MLRTWSVAECASLIAITNNPSRYDPLISDWTLENNRSRQLLVLENMYKQGMIKGGRRTMRPPQREVVLPTAITALANRWRAMWHRPSRRRPAKR